MHCFRTSVKWAVVMLLALPMVIHASTISGTILDSEGNTITEAVRVSISTGDVLEWSHAVTTENGSYTITDVESGTYWIRAEGATSESWLVPTIYPNTWNPRFGQAVSVDTNTDVTGINITVAKGGKVSGAIVPGDGGSFGDDELLMAISAGFNNTMMWEVTSPSEFTSIPLPEGDLKLGFYTKDPTDDYVKTFLGNTYNGVGAPSATITAEQATDIGTITLTVGGGISGTVTGQNSPIENVYIVCQAFITEPSSALMTFAVDYTDADGHFELHAIPAGVGARLYISPPGSSQFVEEWYEDAESFADATDITVTQGGMTTGINVSLQMGAILYGTLQWANGDPITSADDITMLMYDSEGNESSILFDVNNQGDWTSTSLILPGTYTICAKNNSSSHTDADAFAGAGSFSWEADWLIANYAQRVGPYNIQMQTGGGISGVVTLPDGNPEVGIPVRLYKDNILLMDYWTDDSGAFTFSNLPVGDYSLGAFESVWEINPTGTYPAAFSGGASTVGQAGTVTVTEGSTTTSNLQMVQGGVARVEVKDTNGNTYDYYNGSIGIAVYPVTPSGEVLYEVTRIGNDEFAMDGYASMLLPAGNYSFVAVPARSVNNEGDQVHLRRTFLGNVDNFSSAETATITSGEQTNVSITLPLEGHSVSGTATSCTGNRLFGGFTMIIVDANGYPVSMYDSYFDLDDDSFSFAGVTDGEYRMVTFVDYYYGNWPVATTWYPNVGDPFLAYPFLPLAQADAGTITVDGSDVSNLVIEMQNEEFVNGIFDGSTETIPSGYALSNAWPNPFNPTSTLHFTVPSTNRVHVELLNVLGQRVSLLADDVYEAGTHSVVVDGRQLSSGTYFVRMQAPGEMFVRRLTLLK